MAVKKTSKTKDQSAAPTKADAKETAPKKTIKKSAAPKAPAADTTSTPASATTEPAPAASATKPAKAASPKKSAAPKKAAAPAIKLTASQGELLKKVGETADAGYAVGKKIEQRSIDSLLEKKLIKKGAKDKATGTVRYHISSAGKKHIS